ncbi:TPA: LlaJI family restriction endonuclease [Streptococcus pyogenes]|uniref:LlaJI family restriction endonuclease n=1 Tax=Streptococcus pyogenes TaxID=1314 RepID=UPI002B0D56D0|nr:LlaJI family restriction endonuclease [Streptococcus pyogenes]HEQ0393215.1 LlaJI family restriction endonuclease [Streptococcus pyogenes]HEQ0393482.1 LlaJI family restriction endonuclease [Streptococcus pyogenes]HEQ0448369.1 LlaJI family restriction endonuclease [Streptococcus pyogenes]HEQ0448687.1 LlaJI family restriction endonuclease [Streptococcus pyogenes]
MYIATMQELKPYSFFDLQNEFHMSEEELKNILKSLSLMNIVKKLSKDVSKVELEELLETDSLEKLNTELEGNMYVFKYVGMLVIGNVCLLIYPKYAVSYLNDSINNFQKLKQLISVIRKYQSKEQKIGFSSQVDVDNFNLLSIALELIYSYYDHGLYSNDKQIIEQNGCREILWEKTINESTAYFSNGLPIYLDTFTVNQENNEQDYFRRLHAFILSEVCKKLKDILRILDIDTINISSEKREHFGNSEYILYRINQELSSQFFTFKQNILNLLKKYIEEDSGKNSSTNISFVGTNSFNLVWEDVCSEVMDDCINKSIKELGLSYSKNPKQSALISDVIAKPKWKHNISGNVHVANKTLIPDIVTINGDKLSIYDAKYYKIKLDDKGVDKQPGVGDITKQYLYELAYKDFAKENNLVIDSNAFLMPTDGKEEKKVGTASMDIFYGLGDIRLHDIDVILKPCEEMYEIYLEK